MFLEDVAYEVSWNECVWKLCENIDWECYLRMVVWEIADNNYLKEFLKDLMQWFDADTFEKWFWEIALRCYLKADFDSCSQQVVVNNCFKDFWEVILRDCFERLLQTTFQK